MASGPEIPATSTWSESGTDADVTVRTVEQIRTLEDAIRVCQIDLKTWDVDRWVANTWNELFQVKVWLKKRVLQIATQNEIADLVTAAKTSIALIGSRPKSISYNSSGLLLEPSIPDLHAGKLAWGKETGDANYDTKIARTTFEEALHTVLSRMAHLDVQQVVFPVGNDLLNADNATGTTTAGTPQNTDARYQKTFTTVRYMLTEAIESLRLLAPVHVIVCPGNHDTLSTWTMGHSLECYFHTYPDVTIDNLPRTRKYYEFGKVMLMFTHGDKGKKPDYPLVMATEEPAMWARTEFREVHTGHTHKSALDEYHGVKVRVSPALCPPDAWHAENQYVKNGRSAECFAWDKEQGLVGMAFYTVPK